ncbi:DNA polymerase/3'-5' exonuclease PolX [Candidatus Woesearchaeota archaeon]|nr:DNA polymerase/3'-5' exonuclease PolX [Candidatus Woesearchaeota archaeon]
MKNSEVAAILSNIADILELQNVQWKPQAYRKAAQVIETLSEDIEDIWKRGGLEKIPGVGEHIAAKIEEYLKTGKLAYYHKLQKEVKINLEELKGIPALGPKKIKLLYQKLGVKNLQDLEKAIKQQKVQKLSGFGEKTEQALAEGIRFIKTKPKRFLYAAALPIVNTFLKTFRTYPFIQQIEVAGSFRRAKETVGDLDFLAVSPQPEKVMDQFTTMKDVKEILAKGTTKSSVRLSNGLQIDLRVVNDKQFGSAMNYFIGSKEHNIELRKLALSKGCTLSEYGLFTLKEKKWIAGKTENDIYQKLGLQYIEPELRENQGEIAAAQKKNLPHLITVKDLHGVFHNHSTWSDGNNSLLEMAQKAEELDIKFISFNDHFGPIGITNPLTEKRLVGYLKEIESVRKKVGIRVFSGVEIDILKDGTLPLSAKRLKELDVVIASVHLAIKMPAAEMTKRVCSAMENYPINILGHPTDRILNERPPLNLNLDSVFDTAKRNSIFLEINGSPSRMDLSGENVRNARAAGCQFAVSADAHDLSHLPFYHLGVNMARRGWLEKKDVLNCRDLKKIEKVLKK